MNKLGKIKEIAKKIRKAFEEIEESETYNKGDLGGYCARASIQLYLACRREGIRISMVEGIGHMYNKYNGKIIDITATQFGERSKVLIREYKKEPPEYHKYLRKHPSVISIINLWWAPYYEQVLSDGKTVKKYLGD